MSVRDNSIEVLLIEDDPIDREYLCRLFGQAEGIALETANCLHDGIQLIRSGAFDVVVFDLGLPDSYGVDTIRRMTEEFPQLPMIVLTGSDDPLVAEQAFELGVRDFIVKGGEAGTKVLQSARDATHSADTEHTNGPKQLGSETKQAAV